MSSIKVVDVNNEAGANEPMPEPIGDCLNSMNQFKKITRKK